MSTSNPFASGQSVTLEENKIITITKRTVRFGTSVYQTDNIAGFSEGNVNIGTFPWLLIIIFVAIGLIAFSFSKFTGWIFLLAGIGGVAWNFLKPKHYGFLLTLNSSDRKLFVTKDRAGLEKVIKVVYEFIETGKDATYQIKIENSEVKGNFIQGNTGGNVSYDSD